MSSEHDVRVVRLGAITKHPDADTLGITEVDGRPVICRLGDYAEGDLAVYLPVDSVMPDTEQWAFLGKRAQDRRIRAKRLRGVFSMGMLAPAPAGATEGDDVRDALGVTVWEPPLAGARGGGASGGFLGGDAEPDAGHMPTYTDIESLRKYRGCFDAAEEVVASEKVHGSCFRAVWADGRLWVGSRTQYKAPPSPGFEPGIWWRAAKHHALAEALACVPGVVVFGEVYGQVQDLKYGVAPQGSQRVTNEVRFAAFDAFDPTLGRYMDFDAFAAMIDGLGLPRVPVLYRGPFSGLADGLAEGSSVVAAQHGGEHTREGFVVRPIVERWDRRLGRVIAKMVGEGYLTRKGG